MTPPDRARIASQLREIAQTLAELQHNAANLCACAPDAYRAYDGALHAHLIGYHLRGAREELEAVALLIERPAAAAPDVDPAGAADGRGGSGGVMLNARFVPDEFHVEIRERES